MHVKFNGIEFDSEIEGGNLDEVIQLRKDLYELVPRPDASQTDCTSDQDSSAPLRTWFYFSARGFEPGRPIGFTIAKLKRKSKLWRHDMRPSFRVGLGGTWQRLPSAVLYEMDPETRLGTMTFHFSFEDTVTPIYFAVTPAWTLSDHESMMNRLIGDLDPEVVYLHRGLYGLSTMGRPLEMITVTSPFNVLEQTEPRAPGVEYAEDASLPLLATKPCVFLSARVHPGETPGSFVLNGFLKFLLSADPRAFVLRDRFVFKLQPFLNPDGVVMGHWRHDSLGRNLNRVYGSAESIEILSTMGLVQHLDALYTIVLYIDLHAHASKRGMFIYGNGIPQSVFGTKKLAFATQAQLYARLVSLNSGHFDFNGCVFSESMLSVKDRRGESRDGSGRVWAFKTLKSVHAFTLECSYNGAREVFTAPPPLVVPGIKPPLAGPSHSRVPRPAKFSTLHYEDVGMACAVALLDLYDLNPHSRIDFCSLHSLAGVASNIKATLRGKALAKKQPKTISRLHWEALGLPTVDELILRLKCMYEAVLGSELNSTHMEQGLPLSELLFPQERPPLTARSRKKPPKTQHGNVGRRTASTGSLTRQRLRKKSRRKATAFESAVSDGIPTPLPRDIDISLLDIRESQEMVLSSRAKKTPLARVSLG